MLYKVQILPFQASGREIFAPTSPEFPGMLVGWERKGEAGGEGRKKELKDQNVSLYLIFFFFFPEILPKSETKELGFLPDPEFNFPTIDYFQTLSL